MKDIDIRKRWRIPRRPTECYQKRGTEEIIRVIFECYPNENLGNHHEPSNHGHSSSMLVDYIQQQHLIKEDEITLEKQSTQRTSPANNKSMDTNHFQKAVRFPMLG